MTVITALLFGLIIGFSEFIPISSSGHLSILKNLFGIITDGYSHNLFFAFLDLGCLVSVIVVYWQELTYMFSEAVRVFTSGKTADNKQNEARYPYFRMFLLLFAGTLPIFIVLPFNKYFNVLADNTFFVGLSLILNGFALFFLSNMNIGKKNSKNMSFTDAILVGLCQGISFLPGLSKIGITYSAGIACGLKKNYSLKFSVLLSLPALFISSIIRFVAAFKEPVIMKSVPAYLIGISMCILAGIGALYLIKMLVLKNKISKLSYYCWLCGAVCLILTFIF